MSEIINVSIILSFIIGVISSYFVWWFLNKIITPHIQFSENISKQKSSEASSGRKYRVKLENAGRRDIIDVDISVKLTIRGGLNSKRPNNLEITYLPCSFNGKIPIMKPAINEKRRSIIRIDPNKKEEFIRAIYPKSIQEKAKEEKLTLDDLLELGSESYLEIIAMGYDKFSGARKVFVSKEFKKEDLIMKDFNKNSLEME